MGNQYSQAEPPSETTLRFRAFSRKATAVAALVTIACMAALAAAFFGFEAARVEGWGVLGWFIAIPFVPAFVFATAQRASNAVFMRRILNERD